MANQNEQLREQLSSNDRSQDRQPILECDLSGLRGTGHVFAAGDQNDIEAIAVPHGAQAVLRYSNKGRVPFPTWLARITDFQHNTTSAMRVLARDTEHGIAAFRGSERYKSLGHHLRTSAETLSKPEYLFPLGDGLIQAIGSCNEANVVHRDLKPDNVLVMPDKQTARLIDFDTAVLAGTDLVDMETLVGTIEYRSPEQDGHAHAATVQSNIYQLGLLLYTLMQKNHRTRYDIVRSQRCRDEQPATQRFPEAQPVLTDFFNRMLAEVPDDRLSSVEEMRVQWAEAAGRLGIQLPPIDKTV